jgi:hypothetical protein
MKRVWLGISLMVVSLVGLPWLSNPTRGDDNSPYPGVEPGSAGHADCPYWEKMRAYGECHWYHDEEYQHSNACEIIPDEPTADQMVTPMADVAEAASDTESAIETPAPSAVVGATDCWYDGETDAYYHYEFAGAAAAASEDSMTDQTPSSGAESCADEAYAETGCHESAIDSCEADVATEQAWDGDEGYDYADPGEGAEYPYGEADDAQMAVTETVESNEDGAWEDDSYSEYEGEYEEYAASMDEMDAANSVEDQAEAESTEDSEESMQSTTDVAEITAPSAEAQATWPSREYDYKYGGYPYQYESYEPAYVEPTYSEPGYSEPVQAWEDADVEVVEGEDDGECVPPAPASDLVEFDSEVILSLARTLDRVGSTLQSLSQYLTEMATAETAGRHGESLHR